MSMRPTLNLKAPKEKDEKDAGEDGTAAEESWPPCHACFKHCMWAMLADHWNSYVRPPYHVHKASRRNVDHEYNPKCWKLCREFFAYVQPCHVLPILWRVGFSCCVLDFQRERHFCCAFGAFLNLSACELQSTLVAVPGCIFFLCGGNCFAF